MWKTSFGPYVPQNLDICVPTNNMHREDKVIKLLFVLRYFIFIRSSFGAFHTWIKPLSSSWTDNQPIFLHACLVVFHTKTLFSFKTIPFAPPSFLLLLLSQIFAKTGKPRSNHTCIGRRKECDIIYGWPSLKGCDTIRCRQKLFFFTSAICTFLCV